MPVGSYKQIQMARALNKRIFSTKSKHPRIAVATKERRDKSTRVRVSFVSLVPTKSK